MIHFFKRMSFPRAVILVCSLGSLVLGVLVFLRSQRLTEVKQELVKVKEIVKEIQADAMRLDSLNAIAITGKYTAQSEPESYIRAITADGKINIGQVDITKRTQSLKGVEDNIYKIAPRSKTQRYTLGQIGNFLFKLEQDSRRVKVTRLKMTPADKVSPGEVGKGQWVFEADLTTRSKIETPAAASSQG